MQGISAREIGEENFFQGLSQRVEDLEARGKLEEARQAADMGVSAAREAFDTPSFGEDELLLALDVRGGLAYRQGEWDSAIRDFQEALKIYEKERSGEAQGRAEMETSLARVYEARLNWEKARQHYSRAAAAYESANPPAMTECAHLYNNMAFISQEENDYDGAETLFLEALKIFYELHGLHHEDTASVCNNVGNLYYKIEHFEQAREMHKMAIEAREAVLPADDADLAQSRANLALVCLGELKFNEARENFEKAIEIFSKNLPACQDDLEIAADNYVLFLESQYDNKAAKSLRQRVKKLLAKHRRK